MTTAASRRLTTLFLAAVTLIALGAILVAAPGHDWVLNYLSGLVAAVTALAVVARLSLVLPNAAARFHWQLVLLLLVLVSLGQFAEPWLSATGIAAWISYLLLAVALIMPFLIARLDPVPVATQRALWLGILLQTGGIAALGMRHQPNAIAGLVDWSELADLAPLLALQCYLVGTVFFIGYLRQQMFGVRRSSRDVGDVARYLFATSGMFHKLRYPRIGNYPLPGGAFGLGLARFFAWYFPMAPRVKARFGRGFFRQFCDLCAIGFRHGLDAQAFYMFALYQPEMQARASSFLTRYETKNGLFKTLNRQLPKYGKRTPLGDKLAMREMCAANGIPSVPTLAFAEGGRIVCQEQPAAFARDLFLKPQQMKGARGTELIRHEDGLFVTAGGAKLSREGLLDYIAERSKETPLLAQPRLVAHPDLADFVQVSLPPVRVITCLDANEQPVVTHGMLRVLCKLEPDWSADLELGASVDLATGILGEITGDKPDMALDWFADHPITKARVKGRQLPHWDEIRKIALAAHALCPDRLIIGWDIAVTPDGAFMLEGNSYADVDFPQRVHRCGIGDSPLGPLLFGRIVDIERRLAAGTLRRGGKTS